MGVAGQAGRAPTIIVFDENNAPGPAGPVDNPDIAFTEDEVDAVIAEIPVGMPDVTFTDEEAGVIVGNPTVSEPGMVNEWWILTLLVALPELAAGEIAAIAGALVIEWGIEQFESLPEGPGSDSPGNITYPDVPPGLTPPDYSPADGGLGDNSGGGEDLSSDGGAPGYGEDDDDGTDSSDEDGGYDGGSDEGAGED